jgi:hypothetical protein
MIVSSNLSRSNRNRKGNTQRIKMPLTASNFVGFRRTKLEIVAIAFRFTYHVDRLVLMLHDGPIRVVGTNRRFDLEPSRQFHKQTNVVPLVQLASELALNFGIVGGTYS